MNHLGYKVEPFMANAAHFGLPQQRNRAWLMCVLESEAPKDEHMARDVFLFQCEPLPISSCLEPAMQASEQRKQRKGTTCKGEVISEPKWKACFEEQCKIYGKVDLALPGSTFLVNCWGLCFSTPKFSSSAAIMMLTVQGKLYKRMSFLRNQLKGGLTERELAILACSIEEVLTKQKVDPFQGLMCFQVVRLPSRFKQ